MRGRASFALTAVVLLFLLHALSTILATIFATAHAALHPVVRPLLLMPALIPLAAMGTPMMLARAQRRHEIIAAAAIVAALARVPLSLPWHEVRLVAASVVVGAVAVFLASAVGYIERRRIAGAFAVAITTDQLLRLAGWSWDITQRTWWVAPQTLMTVFVIALALVWRRMPGIEHENRRGILERRTGGLRLRSALALGLLLFLDLHFLARPEVAAQWTGVRYELAAVILIGAGAIASLLLLAGHAPIGARRRTAALLTIIAAAAVLLAGSVNGMIALILFALGHASALLLLGRALVPAGGRRPGRNVTILLVAWLLASVTYIGTFYPSFTGGLLMHALEPLLLGAAVLLFALLMLLPRPLETPPPLRGRILAGASLLLVLALATTLALRQRELPVPADAGPRLRVATWNVHHAFDEAWRFDPAAIAEEIEAADADIVALQELGAGLPTAYGVDLVLYLSRRLKERALFSPTHNGLMGDAILHRVAVEGAASVALPTAGIDAREVTSMTVRMQGAEVRILATRLGLSAREQGRQAAVLEALVAAAPGPLVLLGDLNATEADPTVRRLARAGLEDPFVMAGSTPAPTAPAGSPDRRLDWILTRGMAAGAAAVLPAGGSDHRMVTADLRLR